MIRTLVRFAAGAFCLALAGCGVQGEAYQPRPVPVAKSLIYLYRPYVFYASAITPVVTCGPETIELEAGGFYSYSLDPGPVLCSATTESSTQLKFDAHSGEEYYVKEEVSAGNLGSSGSAKFTLVSNAVGQQEIANCRKQGIANSGSHH